MRAACLAVLLALTFSGAPARADNNTDGNADDRATPLEAPSDGKNAPQSRWATPRYPGARIFIDAAGNVFIDDEPATAELLHEAFANLESYNGVVWYNRENPSQEPEGEVAEAVDEVIGILSGYKLAVELFEVEFPDPDAHWQTLDNPPPRFDAASAPPDAKQPER